MKHIELWNIQVFAETVWDAASAIFLFASWRSTNHQLQIPSMVCPNSFRERSVFFETYLGQGRHNGTLDIWILVLEGNGGMEHLAAPGYWVNCFQRPLYFHAENPKVLGAVVEVWPFRFSWAFWKLADRLQEALCPFLKLHTRLPVH